MKNQLKIGVLISGGGSNLQAIIDAIHSKNLTANIVFVGADTPKATGLDRANGESIPTVVTDYPHILRTWRENPGAIHLPEDLVLSDIIAKQNLLPQKTPVEKIKNFLLPRIAAEADLLSKISSFSFDLLVLAGFMRVFTPYFIDHINSESQNISEEHTRPLPRIMNIHPALLPAFPGVNGYEDTFNYGCRIGGCTVHFIDYGEDSGPIIDQKAFNIFPDDTLESIKKKGLSLEWQLYPECIQLYSENRLALIVKNHRNHIIQVSSKK